MSGAVSERGVQPGRQRASSPPPGQDRAAVGRARPACRSPTLAGHEGGVWSAAFSPDGTRVVTASVGQDRAAVGRRDRRAARHARGHTRESCGSAAFSPDGARVVTASWRQDRAALGRRDRQAARATLAGHEGGVSERGVQPGRHAASSPPPTTRPRGSGTPRPARRSPRLAGTRGTVWSAAFSPDGAPRRHRLRRTTPRGCGTPRPAAPLATLAGHEDRCGARRSARTARASSPPPRTRPRGSGTPRPASRSPRSRAISGGVRSAAFSPDGARIVTASVDKTARLWDAADRRAAGQRSRGMRVTCGARRSARTAAASSPPPRTRPRGCGTARLGVPLATLVGHEGELCGARHSARTAAASSPPPGTGPRGCGTARPARRWQRSRGTRVTFRARHC